MVAWGDTCFLGQYLLPQPIPVSSILPHSSHHTHMCTYTHIHAHIHSHIYTNRHTNILFLLYSSIPTHVHTKLLMDTPPLPKALTGPELTSKLSPLQFPKSPIIPSSKKIFAFSLLPGHRTSLCLPRSLAPVSPLAASAHFLVCMAVSIALFLPQTLSSGLREAKSSPVDPCCSSARIFVLACAGGCGTEESQKGAPMSNKKDLRSPRYLNNSDSQIPFHPTCLLGISGSGMLAS